MGAPGHRRHRLENWRCERRHRQTGAFADTIPSGSRGAGQRLSGRHGPGYTRRSRGKSARFAAHLRTWPVERVDFYILAGSGRQAAEQFACRLCEKAYNQGNRIFIRAEDGAQTEALDELLWTFRSGSFLPHARVGADDEDTPIVLGERVPERALDLLVNLAGTLDGPWQNFSRRSEEHTSELQSRPHLVCRL